MKKRLFLFQIALSLLAIGLLFAYIGIDRIYEEAVKADLKYLALAVFFYLLCNLALAWRSKRILDELGEKLPFITMLRCHFLGMLASDVTPARTGYFLTAFSLSNYAPLDKSMVSILGPQLFDFSIKVIGSIIGILLVLSVSGALSENLPFLVLGIAIILAFIILMLLLLFSKRFIVILEEWSEKLLHAFEPLSKNAYYVKLFRFKRLMRKRILKFLKKMQESAWAIRKITPEIFIFSLIAWAFKSVEWYFIGISIGMHFDLVFYAFLQTLLSLMQFIPSPTVAGAGVAEAGAIILLGIVGISGTKAFTYSILTRATMIALDLLGLIELGKAPETFKKLFEQGKKGKV